jgi:hypothetical protein
MSHIIASAPVLAPVLAHAPALSAAPTPAAAHVPAPAPLYAPVVDTWIPWLPIPLRTSQPVRAIGSNSREISAIRENSANMTIHAVRRINNQ